MPHVSRGCAHLDGHPSTAMAPHSWLPTPPAPLCSLQPCKHQPAQAAGTAWPRCQRAAARQPEPKLEPGSSVQPPLYPRGSLAPRPEGRSLPDLWTGIVPSQQLGGRGGSRGTVDTLQVAFFQTDQTETARESRGFVTATGPGSC